MKSCIIKKSAQPIIKRLRAKLTPLTNKYNEWVKEIVAFNLATKSGEGIVAEILENILNVYMIESFLYRN